LKATSISYSIRILCCLLLASALTAQTAPQILKPANELPNLGELKKELKSYHDCTCACGCYAKDLDAQTQRAMDFLNKRVAEKKPGEKLAMVLDIDETSLSNYPLMLREDFGYNREESEEWGAAAKAPAIPGTLRLYKRAQKLGVAVFFITGRRSPELASTEKNLRGQGYTDWAGLTLRAPDQVHMATIAYKSGERKKIVEQGYKIILSVGDQMSDLLGNPQAEMSVKLPNPYYYLP